MTFVFYCSETTSVVAQKSPLNYNIGRNNSTQSSLNSTNVKLESDDKHIVVTWLKANETETDAPVINITSQEFWKAFSPLFEISINRTIDNSQ